MAGRRGRTKSYEEQIAQVEQKISALKQRLAEQEEIRSELLHQQEEQSLRALQQCMTEKGISLEYLYDLIDQAQNDPENKIADWQKGQTA